MSVYRMEDIKIMYRVGREVPTCIYETTRIGTRRKVTKYEEFFLTKIGEFDMDKWYELSRNCIINSGSVELLKRIIDHCRLYCAWLKKEKDIEQYAIVCLIAGAYRNWKDFSFSDLEENTVFIFEFREDSL